MDSFKVVGIIDGNTLQISPNWKLGDSATGDTVKVAGYDAPKTGKRALAIEQKLSVMLQNKTIQLDKPGGVENGKLVCNVYFKGVNLSDYFQEFREPEVKPEAELSEYTESGQSDVESQDYPEQENVPDNPSHS